MRGMARFGTRAAMAACMAWAQTVAAQPAPITTGDTEVFSADVVIEDSIVDAKGAVVETRPSTRFHLTRRQVDGGIETEITYPTTKLYAKGPLVDPRSGMRMVYGANGVTRIYDANGALLHTIEMPPPPDADPEAAVVFTDRDVRRRRDALQRRMGRASGRLGRHDRYVATEGEATTETLVEPGTMLPTEVNVVRDGALAERNQLAYARMPGGRWYLARQRSEHAMTDGSGRRFVSTRTHLNVSGSEGR